MGRDITRPPIAGIQVPAKNNAVKTEPYEHLFQHIKQTDPMLYEALKRMSKDSTVLGNVINQVVGGGTPTKFDKATFGLLKPLVIGTALTNYYICRKDGSFIDCALKNKVAPDSSDNDLPTILDIQLSKDDGGSWSSLFNTSNKITIPDGSVSTIIVPKDSFGLPSISVGNLLRIDCPQVATPNPGSDFEVVLRWQ